jgi:hypothetical protein
MDGGAKLQIPDSSYNDCKCVLYSQKCTCGHEDYMEQYSKKVEDNFYDIMYKISKYSTTPKFRDILGYKYPGDYECYIVDYYYENEAKPRHLRRKKISPFDLLNDRQLDKIIRRCKKKI